jgi:HK97 family phage major capsid protein
MKDLASLLNRRDEIVAELRELGEAIETEKRTLTAEEQTSFDKLLDESRSINETIKRVRALEALEAGIDPDESRSKTIAGDGDTDPGDADKNRGFANFGEFVRTAIQDPHKVRAMGVDEGPSGGFAVPEGFISTILKVPPEQVVVRPRARVLPAGEVPDQKINVPALKQGADGVYGGVTFKPVGEGDKGKENDPKLRSIALEPQKFSGWVLLGNDLLRNASAMSAFVEQLFRDAKAGYEDQKFITGTGTAEPRGFLNALGALTVKRNTTDDIKFVDIVAMRSKISDPSGAGWIINQSAMANIINLADAAGNSIFIAGDAARGIPPQLLDLPIRWTTRGVQLGTKGDISLVNLRYYLIKDGSGPFLGSSEHVKFLEDQTAVKLIWHVDGQSWVNEALTTESGLKVSPFVILNK